MKHSPLQLLRYFVPEMSFSANQAFNPEKACESGNEQFSVEAVVTKQKALENFPGHSWSVEMVISQKIKEGQNFPYQFKLTLVGMFACKDGVMTDDIENQFVRVNGSSMLYGAARELVRLTTTLGPWGEIILPTISFYNKEATQKEQNAPVPKAD
jgi:preprotein translocase subunit SecB